MSCVWDVRNLIARVRTFFFLDNSRPSFSVSVLYHNHKCHFFLSSLLFCVWLEGSSLCCSLTLFSIVDVCLD